MAVGRCPMQAQCAHAGHALAPISRIHPIHPSSNFYCTRDALDFLAKLSRKYSGRVTQLLERRREQQARFDAGEKPVFLPETKKVRMLLV